MKRLTLKNLKRSLHHQSKQGGEGEGIEVETYSDSEATCLGEDSDESAEVPGRRLRRAGTLPYPSRRRREREGFMSTIRHRLKIGKGSQESWAEEEGDGERGDEKEEGTVTTRRPARSKSMRVRKKESTTTVALRPANSEENLSQSKDSHYWTRKLREKNRKDLPPPPNDGEEEGDQNGEITMDICHKKVERKDSSDSRSSKSSKSKHSPFTVSPINCSQEKPTSSEKSRLKALRSFLTLPRRSFKKKEPKEKGEPESPDKISSNGVSPRALPPCPSLTESHDIFNGASSTVPRPRNGNNGSSYEPYDDEDNERKIASYEQVGGRAHVNHSLTEELRKLVRHGWYWGPISRAEAEEKLAHLSNGSFLVRDSSDDRYLLSLSFRSYDRTFHTRIEHCNGIFSFYSQVESEGHKSIVDLIEHSMRESQSAVFCYSRSRTPGAPSFPVRLTNPVSRFTQVRTLQYLCRFVIRQYTRIDHIQLLPLPTKIREYLQECHY
ncbi:suppressor of cytokine signaling 6-like [Branchiostoma lanceolatum]|uniref:suppressor of cytokine signaling 6-like n=1 Tax=Branchiostoma lanceolatum TaxID=7740 RepID=UPI00345236E5